MPNLNDIARIFQADRTDEETLAQAFARGTQAQLGDLARGLQHLPETFSRQFPRTHSTIADNGDLVRLPFYAHEFSLIYSEGMLGDPGPDGEREPRLRKVLQDAGLHSYQPWVPQDEFGEGGQALEAAAAVGKGNVAWYGIEFRRGDLGSYLECFVLIKLRSKTVAGPTTPWDFFVWHLCVDDRRAAAWGSPWRYDKKAYSRGDLEFTSDSMDVPQSFRCAARDGRPGIDFTRPKGLSLLGPLRWSHAALGGGFSFINPVRQPYAPRGFTAPIQNQGEYRFALLGSAHRAATKLHASGDYALLDDVEWRSVFLGTKFEAVAFEGHEAEPRQARPASPSPQYWAPVYGPIPAGTMP